MRKGVPGARVRPGGMLAAPIPQRALAPYLDRLLGVVLVVAQGGVEGPKVLNACRVRGERVGCSGKQRSVGWGQCQGAGRRRLRSSRLPRSTTRPYRSGPRPAAAPRRRPAAGPPWTSCCALPSSARAAPGPYPLKAGKACTIRGGGLRLLLVFSLVEWGAVWKWGCCLSLAAMSSGHLQAWGGLLQHGRAVCETET